MASFPTSESTHENELHGSAVTAPPISSPIQGFGCAAAGSVARDVNVSWSTRHWARQAAVLIFCDPIRDRCLRLLDLDDRQWHSLLHWLDTSGLSLYFLDRIVEVQLHNWLPAPVIDRLQQNLANNTRRTDRMIVESTAIQQEFQSAGLSYALLKGFSLWPNSVPRPELRQQFDLDFLVAEQCADHARRVLERRGYRLSGISGRSLEFKTGEAPAFSMKNLYKDFPCTSVELHIESSDPRRRHLLEHVEQRDFNGIRMPVLSPVDLFLGQALHTYKHICSESSRTAYLVEFRRHVISRRGDASFWEQLRTIASDNPKASLGLGLVTLLTASAMDDFAPEDLTRWTVARLPPAARLWGEMYGARAVFESFPGSKLYLLLERELESAGVPAKRPARQALLPTRLPTAVMVKSGNESWSTRARRYLAQLRYIVFRVRFHTVAGLRYAFESYRWKQRVERLTQ